MIHYEKRGYISSIYSGNSEADASELLENIEGVFLRRYMDELSSNLQTLVCFSSLEGKEYMCGEGICVMYLYIELYIKHNMNNLNDMLFQYIS